MTVVMYNAKNAINAVYSQRRIFLRRTALHALLILFNLQSFTDYDKIALIHYISHAATLLVILNIRMLAKLGLTKI